MASDLKDASTEVASDTAQKDDRFWHYPRGAIALDSIASEFWIHMGESF